MKAAGAVGDVVPGEGVAVLVELGESVRFGVRCVYEWQRGMRELCEAGVEPRAEFDGVADFAVLPGSFEAGRVRESAGGEGGVGELPEEEIGRLNMRTRLQPGVRRARKFVSRFSGFHAIEGSR